MKCREVKCILLEKKAEEISSAENDFLFEHLKDCNDCHSFFEKNSKADKILSRIKFYQPPLTDPDIVTERIIGQIELMQKYRPQEKGIINRIILYTVKPKIRFALSCALILIMSGYFIQEFSAVNNILDLEKKFNRLSSQDFYQSQIIPQDFGAFGFIYRFYKFLNNNSDFFEVSKNVVLIKKDKLEALFAEYDKLDEVQKQKINTLKKELFGSQTLIQDSKLFSDQNIKIDKQKFESAVKILKAEGVKNEK